MESPAPIVLELPAQTRPIRMGLVLMDGELLKDDGPMDMICFVSPSLLAMISLDSEAMATAETGLLAPGSPPVPVEMVARLLNCL